MPGRPPKEGIDYSVWAVDIFDSEPKMDALLDAKGWVGFAIYFYLCQRAYGAHGYFLEWRLPEWDERACRLGTDDIRSLPEEGRVTHRSGSGDGKVDVAGRSLSEEGGVTYRSGFVDGTIAATVARKMGGGIKANTVSQTVNLCCKIGLFDASLLEGLGIITSRGIQRRYVQAIAKRSSKVVIKDYWLLEIEESEGLVFRTQKSSILSDNTDFLPENGAFRVPKCTKVKESKVKENKGLNTYAQSQNFDPVSGAVQERETTAGTTGVDGANQPDTASSPVTRTQTDVVIDLPLNDNTTHFVTSAEVTEWRELYQAVDIMVELRKLKGWLNANPRKRKTKQGINRFIAGWLSREQDRGGGHGNGIGWQHSEQGGSVGFTPSTGFRK